MGATMSCIEAVQSLGRLQYDLSEFHKKSLPIVWMNGVECSGRKTLGKLFAEKFGFEYIDVDELIREEREKDTDRAKSLKLDKNKNKPIADTIIMDLIKEKMITASDNQINGIILTKFPQNSTQAELFITEIGNADIMFYLDPEIPVLVQRIKNKSENKVKVDDVRKRIFNSLENIEKVFRPFQDQYDKIDSSGTPETVFENVENLARTKLKVSPSEVNTDTTKIMMPAVTADFHSSLQLVEFGNYL